MSVPLKFPTRTPSGPWSSTTTSRIVIPIVTQHVREARDRIADGALLDPEERGQLVVVHGGPEADERRADEVGVLAGLEERSRDRLGEDEPGDQRERRRSHREPERRPDDRRVAARSSSASK